MHFTLAALVASVVNFLFFFVRLAVIFLNPAANCWTVSLNFVSSSFRRRSRLTCGFKKKQSGFKKKQSGLKMWVDVDENVGGCMHVQTSCSSMESVTSVRNSSSCCSSSPKFVTESCSAFTFLCSASCLFFALLFAFAIFVFVRALTSVRTKDRSSLRVFCCSTLAARICSCFAAISLALMVAARRTRCPSSAVFGGGCSGFHIKNTPHTHAHARTHTHAHARTRPAYPPARR